MVNVILNCDCRVSLKINVSNVAVFCTSRGLWCCQCWGFHLWLPGSYLTSFPSFNTTGCFGALLIGSYVFPANRTLKSFLIFLGLSSRVCLFSSSWQDSAPPVPALVGTWQPQWKAAGRTVLKNEVNNLSEHLWASSLFKSDPPPPSTHPLSVSSHLSIFFFSSTHTDLRESFSFSLKALLNRRVTVFFPSSVVSLLLPLFSGGAWRTVYNYHLYEYLWLK